MSDDGATHVAYLPNAAPLGQDEESGRWKVKVGAKTVKLTLVARPKTFWGEWGFVEQMKVGETITIRRNGGPHAFRETVKNHFVVYPDRLGKPVEFRCIADDEALDEFIRNYRAPEAVEAQP